MKCLKECGLYLNQKYCDAEKAFPTLLEKLYNIKIEDLDNKEELGKIIKKHSLEYIYQLLESHSRTLCIINNGIAYNLDAFIAPYCNHVNSILKYRLKHSFKYILISKNGYYGYDCLNNEFIRKGIYKKIPAKLLSLLTRLYLDKSGIEYIKYFDMLFNKLPNSYFYQDEVLLENNRIISGSILSEKDKVNREYYFRLIIKYVAPYLNLDP